MFKLGLCSSKISFSSLLHTLNWVGAVGGRFFFGLRAGLRVGTEFDLRGEGGGYRSVPPKFNVCSSLKKPNENLQNHIEILIYLFRLTMSGYCKE